MVNASCLIQCVLKQKTCLIRKFFVMIKKIILSKAQNKVINYFLMNKVNLEIIRCSYCEGKA